MKALQGAESRYEATQSLDRRVGSKNAYDLFKH